MFAILNVDTTTYGREAKGEEARAGIEAVVASDKEHGEHSEKQVAARNQHGRRGLIKLMGEREGVECKRTHGEEAYGICDARHAFHGEACQSVPDLDKRS